MPFKVVVNNNTEKYYTIEAVATRKGSVTMAPQHARRLVGSSGFCTQGQLSTAAWLRRCKLETDLHTNLDSYRHCRRRASFRCEVSASILPVHLGRFAGASIAGLGYCERTSLSSHACRIEQCPFIAVITYSSLSPASFIYGMVKSKNIFAMSVSPSARVIIITQEKSTDHWSMVVRLVLRFQTVTKKPTEASLALTWPACLLARSCSSGSQSI